MSTHAERVALNLISQEAKRESRSLFQSERVLDMRLAPAETKSLAVVRPGDLYPEKSAPTFRGVPVREVKPASLATRIFWRLVTCVGMGVMMIPLCFIPIPNPISAIVIPAFAVYGWFPLIPILFTAGFLLGAILQLVEKFELN